MSEYRIVWECLTSLYGEGVAQTKYERAKTSTYKIIVGTFSWFFFEWPKKNIYLLGKAVIVNLSENERAF